MKLWTENDLERTINSAPERVLAGKDLRGNRVCVTMSTWEDVQIMHRDRIVRLKLTLATDYLNSWGFREYEEGEAI